MKTFEDLFIKSNGECVEYKGRTIQMFDRLVIADGQKFRLVVESVNSDWRQGIHMTVDEYFEVNSQITERSLVLWQDTAPPEIILRVKTKKCECVIKNFWDVGDGVIHSWHNGGAMIVDKMENGFRYRCNDGKNDDDFDDLVFRLEYIN